MSNDSTKHTGRLFGREKRRGARLPWSVVIVAVLVALFALITPYGTPTNINPGTISVPPPTARPTAAPKPTDRHGGTIVFTCTRGDINQICLIRADGTGYEQLTSGSSNSYYPAISHDGRHIIFAANQYDGFDLQRLAPEVVEGSRTLESRFKRLTDYIGNAFSPSFSPDDDRVLFINRAKQGPAALWMIGADGTNPRTIYSPPNDVVGAAWSPDGKRVAFAMAVDTPFAYQIFLLDLDDVASPPLKVPCDLQDLGGSISWSPDQTHLLVFAGPAAAREIYRLEISSGRTTQLTFGGNNASGDYSPDGEYIVFNSRRNDGQADLYIMRADGHSMRRLTDNPEPDWQPQWGP